MTYVVKSYTANEVTPDHPKLVLVLFLLVNKYYRFFFVFKDIPHLTTLHSVFVDFSDPLISHGVEQNYLWLFFACRTTEFFLCEVTKF